MWPAANVGIRPPVGVVVLDIDPRNGGHRHLAAMQGRFGLLPGTLTACTGSGGLHLWFRCPGPVVGKLADGIDVKSHAGYLVAPPSVHVCGGRYEWITQGAIVAAPLYLRRLLARPDVPKPRAGRRATAAVVAGLLRVVAEAPEGTRNGRLYWACCRAVERGVDVNPLVDAAVNNGLTRAAAEATAASAARAGAA